VRKAVAAFGNWLFEAGCLIEKTRQSLATKVSDKVCGGGFPLSTLDPRPSTLDPRPSTLDPRPSTKTKTKTKTKTIRPFSDVEVAAELE
jgi:hypothetical protein